MDHQILSHAPHNYTCPFCTIGQLEEQPEVASRLQDVVLRGDKYYALVPTRQWPNNKGPLLIIPYRHFENLYSLPTDHATELLTLSQRLAKCFKSIYRCDGISTRQHNEPGGGQDVWHFHLHVMPRYSGDNLYKSDPIEIAAEERAHQAVRIRDWLHG